MRCWGPYLVTAKLMRDKGTSGCVMVVGGRGNDGETTMMEESR